MRENKDVLPASFTCFPLSSQFSKDPGRSSVLVEGREAAKQAKKGFRGQERAGRWHASHRGRSEGEERAAEGGRGDPQQQSTVMSGVSHMESWMLSLGVGMISQQTKQVLLAVSLIQHQRAEKHLGIQI